MSRFANDTAVRPLGDGCYEGTIDPGWWIERGPNGGYLAAIVLRAILAEAGGDGRRPRSLTLHYLRPPVAGPCEVLVTVERAGRGLSTVTARLRQDGRDCILALAALGTDRPGAVLHERAMPDVPSPEALPRQARPEGVPTVPMAERYETVPALGAAPFQPASEALTGGWIRTSDEDPIDDVLVAALTDAWPPAVFARLERVGVPTVELTMHFRNRPPETPGWCLVRFETVEVSEGYLDESGEVWSADGTLLAQCRQLGALLTPG